MKPDPKFIKKIQAAIRERQFWKEVEEAIINDTTKPITRSPNQKRS